MPLVSLPRPRRDPGARQVEGTRSSTSHPSARSGATPRWSAARPPDAAQRPDIQSVHTAYIRLDYTLNGNTEVFSPAIRTSSKGAVGAAGQGQRPVVGDFDHGYSVRVPPRGTWHLRWHMRLTCSDALSGGPCTADPGEKTSFNGAGSVCWFPR